MMTRSPFVEQTKVVFTYCAPHATNVRLAGTFNEWSPEATPLTYAGDGEWAVWLMLAPGEYKYRFVVDGVWHADPLATENAANPYGGMDSMLTVKMESAAEYI